MISEIKFGKKYCRITFKLLFSEISDSLAQGLPLETPIYGMNSSRQVFKDQWNSWILVMSNKLWTC